MTQDLDSPDPVTTTETATHKADFGALYTAQDPRLYFRTLLSLGYQIPQLATPVIETVLEVAEAENGRHTVLDLCCSYGITSAMLFGPDGPVAAAQRYADPQLDDLTSTKLAAADRRYFTPRRRPARVVGLDVSSPGVAYGRRSGLLDDGWAEDLESDPPSTELATGLRDVGLVVCTGGYGYVGPATFERILDAVAEPSKLWLAVWVLRVFDYAPTAALLAEHGLVTERLPGTFPQRRFADPAEAEAAVTDVRRRGLDPTGLESEGWFHAECFLSRPAASAARTPAWLLWPEATMPV